MTIATRLTTLFSSLLLVSLVACAPAEQRASAGQVIDDTLITGKVKAALVADPELKATEINVDTYKGTVQLSGFVSAPEHIPKAAQLVRRIDGVKDVKNDIAVKR
ncbi:BON domain-containing protein [Massilia sp. PAMC28688]|uniref:BON domain-containing protein n=1 Tax=Massilia sp. PAMC28688 TaxID=2861283 RepID=UPI001C62A3D7|nr:BON domain-containing protein [Massilia sp. PAMC28688]QYF95023.1 BON domain-containing protein [Massilia sp. PAMC28688]